MVGRASNGESSIHKGADGRWHGYVSVGFKANGRPDSRHVSSRNRSVVVGKVRELERKRDNGTVSDVSTRPPPRGSSTGSHHRPAPGATANAGELRVRRPQAPDPR